MPKPKQQAAAQKPPSVDVGAKSKAASPPKDVSARSAAAEQPRGVTPAATTESVDTPAGAAMPVSPPPLSREQMHRLRHKLKTKFH